MLQVLIKKGGIVTDNIPSPSVTSNGVLIKVHYSCVSLGTESSTVQDSGKSLYQKAKEKPEKVKKVLSKLIADGPVSTLSMVRGELNISNATGYSLSGEVIAVGKDVAGFQVGDLVAAAGGTANHAEIVNVPHMLVSKLESRSELKVASSVAIGSIALHGVRRAGLLLGETCVVIGAGIIGLITIQLLVKSGVRVFVIDLDEKKLKLASE
jgi:threonine dehydrogenase-like Zn-dependent dehydrogenase